MTSHSLRLPRGDILSGVLLLVVITCASIALYHHWGPFIQWCLASQITLHRYLVLYLLQLNNHQYIGGLWLLTGAFIYGLLHAVGPGHGKFVVTTWLSTTREKPIVARVVPFLGSLMQGVCAIAFVFILAVGFNLASGDLSQSRWYIEKVSALFVGGFGIYVLWHTLRGYLRLRRPVSPVIHAIHPLDTQAPSSGHQHSDHCGCGHQHGVDYDASGGNWKTHLGVILAVGMRPCSGAIMILLFSNALGIISWGIAAVMTMALGTGLAIVGLSLGVDYMRERVSKIWLSPQPETLQRVALILRAAGGIILVIFALVLFLTVIPVSANGDFIAAGC